MAISGRLKIKSKNADVVAEAVTALVSTVRAVPTAQGGSFDYYGDFVGWSDFALGESQTESGFALENSSFQDRLVCAITTKGNLKYIGHGKEVTVGSGEAVMCDTRCIDTARFSENYSEFFITTSMPSVERYARQKFGHANRSFSGSYVFLPKTHLAAVSLAGFTPLINLLLSDKELLKLSPIKMRRCQDAFLDIIASSLSANGTFLGVRNDSLGSSRNVREAEAFMREYAKEPIGVSEVARAVGVSIRSLQLAFKRHTGVTPLARLQRIRLEGLHAELATGASSAVRVVAAGWGFVSGARLNRQYFEAFGEAPSDTVKRVRR